MEQRARQAEHRLLRDQVTTEGGPDYVKPEERIATFDNDGTLWIEQQTMYEFGLGRSTR